MKLVSAIRAVCQGAGVTFAPNTFFSIGFARNRAKVPAGRAAVARHGFRQRVPMPHVSPGHHVYGGTKKDLGFL